MGFARSIKKTENHKYQTFQRLNSNVLTEKIRHVLPKSGSRNQTDKEIQFSVKFQVFTALLAQPCNPFS